MAEMDPIVKTVYIVCLVVAILIIVLILYAKNNPIFAQTILNLVNRFTNEVTGYNQNPTTPHSHYQLK
jgi:hypothetical protein